MVQDENVLFSINQILTMLGHLSEAKQLTMEKTTHIISGLKLWLFDNFRKPLGLFLNKYYINNMSFSLGIADTSEYILASVE